MLQEMKPHWLRIWNQQVDEVDTHIVECYRQPKISPEQIAESVWDMLSSFVAKDGHVGFGRYEPDSQDARQVRQMLLDRIAKLDRNGRINRYNRPEIKAAPRTTFTVRQF
jgi:hypothetical protein